MEKKKKKFSYITRALVITGRRVLSLSRNKTAVEMLVQLSISERSMMYQIVGSTLTTTSARRWGWQVRTSTLPTEETSMRASFVGLHLYDSKSAGGRRCIPAGLRRGGRQLWDPRGTGDEVATSAAVAGPQCLRAWPGPSLARSRALCV